MKKTKELTGMYFRIKRDEKWQSLDISDLENDEIKELLKDFGPEDVCGIVIALAGWIYDNVSVIFSDEKD